MPVRHAKPLLLLAVGRVESIILRYDFFARVTSVAVCLHDSFRAYAVGISVELFFGYFHGVNFAVALNSSHSFVVESYGLSVVFVFHVARAFVVCCEYHGISVAAAVYDQGRGSDFIIAYGCEHPE